MNTQLTPDMLRLLCIINYYTSDDPESSLKWVKELPMLAIIYQGIIDGFFPSYDYAPWSVQMLDGTRQWLNISREGKDDIEDLLELRMISVLRLSTSDYGYVTAYRLSELGRSEVEKLDADFCNTVRELIDCSCGSLKEVIIKDRKFFFQCQCGDDVPITIDEMEDISYESKAYLPGYLRLGDGR